MLENSLDRRDPLYTSYPNDNILNNEYLSGANVKGTFSALNDEIALVMDPKKMDEYVDLFEWQEDEIKYLNSLKVTMGRYSSNEKRFLHISNVCNVIYSICVGRNNLITKSPGFDWQRKV